MLSFLRASGWISVVYLDDWWLMGSNKRKCQKNINQTISLLTKLGFLINERKSVLVPSNSCKFLGFVLNSRDLTLDLTPEKRVAIAKLVSSMRNKESCKIEELASLLGKLIAACPAVPYGWLYTKRAEYCKILALDNNGQNYQGIMNIPKNLNEDWD